MARGAYAVYHRGGDEGRSDAPLRRHSHVPRMWLHHRMFECHARGEGTQSHPTSARPCFWAVLRLIHLFVGCVGH